MDEDINKALESLYTETFDTLEKKSSESIYSELAGSEVRYTEKRKIAAGSMKKIFQVKDTQTDRLLSMAVPTSNEPPERELFLREARITGCLQHQNIIPVHEIGLDETGIPYFTMKLIEGGNLAGVLKDLSGSSENKLEFLLEIFLKVCEAIAYAHDRGVIHLDLNPENIQTGAYGEVLVCDWGVSKIIYQECQEDILFKNDLFEADLELRNSNRGTPGYMAPEQFQSNRPITKLADVYSLGCILYSILTFEKPLNVREFQLLKSMTLDGCIPKPSERKKSLHIPEKLEDVCMKAMSVNEPDRFQSVSDLMQAVNLYLKDPQVDGKTSFVQELMLLYSNNKTLLNIFGLLLLVIAAFLSYIL